MTQDERNMLTDLANKIAQTPSPQRDPEAEDLIRTKIGSRPDALYLMTQTVLIQNLALQHAQQQIQELQQRAGQPQLSSSGSFLGQGAPPPPRGGYAQSGPQQYSAPQQQYAAPQYAPAPSSGGASSFLKGAAQTAAGVAAGGLAFEAINSLFSHGSYGGGGGFFGGGGIGGGPVEETVVNNYYDEPRGDDYRADDAGNYDDSANVDNSTQYDDASYDPGDGGGGGFDDSGDNFS
jgi:hypothetical protein